MADRHVKPIDDGWAVEKENAQRPSAKVTTRAEAINRAVEIIANDGGGNLVVYGTDGSVRERRAVEPGSDEPAGTAVKATASATGNAARDTAAGAAHTVGAAADEVRADTADTARTVADEVTASAERSAGTARSVADRGADSAVRTADRAARVGARAEDDLDDAGARFAHRLREDGERVATRIDALAARVSRPLNPVRFGSRVAAGAVATAFGVTGAVTAGAGRLFQRGARTTTGR